LHKLVGTSSLKGKRTKDYLREKEHVLEKIESIMKKPAFSIKKADLLKMEGRGANFSFTNYSPSMQQL
jgi:hypothetical protein